MQVEFLSMENLIKFAQMEISVHAVGTVVNHPELVLYVLYKENVHIQFNEL